MQASQARQRAPERDERKRREEMTAPAGRPRRDRSEQIEVGESQRVAGYAEPQRDVREPQYRYGNEK